jgi:homogentisate phytyltransferase/homogentisate geranylgeranyltransferase
VPWLYAFWKFSRPHTIVGTTLSVFSLYTIAIATAPTVEWNIPSSIGWAIAAWLTCLCGNIYIVGLNQVYDIDIDRMNKPHLPLASGEFSSPVGWSIVMVTGLIALVTAPLQSAALTVTVWASLAIGTAYSLPPIRLKRFPFWASVCIFTVRGVIVNLGLFLHFQTVLGHAFKVTPPVWALTAFVLVFTFAIAIFKDIPDLEGDRRYNITTFTVQLGPRVVFNMARWVMTFCYGGMMLASFWLPSVNTVLMLVTHTLALGVMWILSQRVNLHSKQSIAQFYQFIWKLFFLEYLIFPAACLLG